MKKNFISALLTGYNPYRDLLLRFKHLASKAVDISNQMQPIQSKLVHLLKFYVRNCIYAHFDRSYPLDWNFTSSFVSQVRF